MINFDDLPPTNVEWLLCKPSEGFVNLPLEIIVIILEQLSFEDLIKLSQVNRELREIIKSVRWRHTVKLNKWTDEKLIYFVNNYNFINFDLRNSKITDTGLKVFNDHYCHTVNISGCSLVTDEGIKALSGCNTVILYGCNLVTNEVKKYLKDHGCITY